MESKPGVVKMNRARDLNGFPPIYMFRTNHYSRSGSNSIEGFLHTALSYLLEGSWCIFILLLFVIGFNPYHVYALLYSIPTYGDISICSYLGCWIGSNVSILTFFEFFNYALILYPIFYMSEFYDF